MAPRIAALAFIVGIAGLFWLDRDKHHKASKALWIPFIWFFIACSRALSEWIYLGPSPAQTNFYMEGSPLDRNFYLVLLILGLLVLFSRANKVAKILSSNAPILLFILYGAVSVLWSDYPGIGIKRWIKALGDLVMILIVLTDAEPVVAIKRLFARLGFLLLPLSVLFIRYYPDLGRSYNRWTWEPSFTGVSTNKNMLGLIALICGLAAVWRLAALRQDKSAPDRGRHLLAQGFLALNAMYILFIARSATPMSCFYLGAVLILAAGRPAFLRHPGRLHLLTAGEVCLAAFPLFLGASGLLEFLGKDPTLTGRTEIWREILKVAPNPVLGTGYGTFWLGNRLAALRQAFEGNPLMESHNGYIEVYVNLGMIGVILLLIIIVVGYGRIFLALRQKAEDASLRLAFMLTAVIYNFTEAAFKEVNPVWIFFLYAAVSLPADPVPEKPIPVFSQPAKRKLTEANAVPTR